MRRVALAGMAPADRRVLQNGGGVARTLEDYATFSTGWDVRPVGDPPHSTTVQVWRGESMTVVHCGGTPVSVRRGPEHLHIYGDWLKLSMPMEGVLSIRQGDQAFQAKPGELASVAYTQTFDLVGAPNSSFFLIYVSFASLRNRGLSRDAVSARKWTEGPLLPALRVLLQQLFEQHEETTSLAVENALFEVTANIVAEDGRTGGDRLQKARAVALIGAHFHDPELGPDWLAGQLNVSRSTLFAMAREDGASIADMIRARRITHARHLLASQPELSLRRLARLCGFRGPDQLSRAFRDIIGVTPSAFREDVHS